MKLYPTPLPIDTLPTVRSGIKHVLITHAHTDHVRASRVAKPKPYTLHCSPITRAKLLAAGAHPSNVVGDMAPGADKTIGGVRVRAFDTAHSPGSVGFHFLDTKQLWVGDAVLGETLDDNPWLSDVVRTSTVYCDDYFVGKLPRSLSVPTRAESATQLVALSKKVLGLYVVVHTDATHELVEAAGIDMGHVIGRDVLFGRVPVPEDATALAVPCLMWFTMHHSLDNLHEPVLDSVKSDSLGLPVFRILYNTHPSTDEYMAYCTTSIH